MVSAISNKEKTRVSSKTTFAGHRQVAGERIYVDPGPIQAGPYATYLGCNLQIMAIQPTNFRP